MENTRGGGALEQYVSLEEYQIQYYSIQYNSCKYIV